MSVRALFTVLMWVGIAWLFGCVGLGVASFWTVGALSTSLGESAWLFGCAGVVATIVGWCGRDQK